MPLRIWNLNDKVWKWKQYVLTLQHDHKTAWLQEPYVYYTCRKGLIILFRGIKINFWSVAVANVEADRNTVAQLYRK